MMFMHPELLNNPLFLRYYHQWQHDPQSIVFVAIADFFLRYGLLDEALKVCREGLQHHPGLISAQLLTAKIHVTRGNWEEAEEEIHAILMNQPGQQQALVLYQKIKEAKTEEEKRSLLSEVAMHSSLPKSWETITMGRIFCEQGHVAKARKIFEAILARDPHNAEAINGLKELST